MLNSDNSGIHNSHLLHPRQWTRYRTGQARLHYSTVNLLYILVSGHANDINLSSCLGPHWYSLKESHHFRAWWETRRDYYKWLWGSNIFSYSSCNDSRPHRYVPFASCESLPFPPSLTLLSPPWSTSLVLSTWADSGEEEEDIACPLLNMCQLL